MELIKWLIKAAETAIQSRFYTQELKYSNRLNTDIDRNYKLMIQMPSIIYYENDVETLFNGAYSQFGFQFGTSTTANFSQYLKNYYDSYVKSFDTLEQSLEH